MKNKYFALTSIMTIMAGTAFGQWTDVINRNINFLYEVDNNWYGGANDPDGTCDPYFLNDFYVNSNGGSWTGWQCYGWEDCVAPCYNYSNPIAHAFFDQPFNTSVQITAQFYESDNIDGCTPTAGDNNYWNGYATFRDGLNYLPVTYPSSDFYPGAWNANLGVGGTGWIFPQSQFATQIWKQVWRYRAGNTINDLLNFGTLAIGNTKIDVNSNRTVTPNDGLFWYTHTSASLHSSPDVWYEFTLTETAKVTMTTTHARTNFDTYIRLYDSNNVAIDGNDDEGDGLVSSGMTLSLCAGTYKLMVEGYQNATGVYQLTVSVDEPFPIVPTYQIEPTSCPGVADGSVTVETFAGGVPPLTWTWDGAFSTNMYFDNLEPAEYTLVITDACGTSTTETIAVTMAEDTEDPVAQCVPSITLSISEGDTVTLVFEDFDNGSYDNCALYAYGLTQNAFTVADEGSTTVTLFLYDEAGNESSCATTVQVVNTTGVSEQALLQKLHIYPNPNNGSFRLDMSGADLSQGAQLDIMDNTGRSVYSKAVSLSVHDIDLGAVAKGLYLFRLNVGGTMATKQLVVQ